MSQQWRGAPRATGWENYGYRRDRVSDQETLPTIAAGGCWCGLPYGHDWPGKDQGESHPREDWSEEVTTMSDIHVTPRDFPKFSPAIARIICDLVNNHGVRHRVPKDGVHVFLYNGEQKTGPYKLSASRQDASTMRHLTGWIEKNVPAYYEGEVKPDDIKTLAAALNTTRPVVEDTSPATEGDSGAATEEVPSDGTPGRTPYIGPNGKDIGFETDGTRYFCTSCDYVREGSTQGLHLHARKHLDPEGLRKDLSKANSASHLAKQQRNLMIREAARVVAEAHGWRVSDKAEPSAKGLERKVGRLEREVERLTAQVSAMKLAKEEAETRLSLIKEAMKA